MCVKWEIMVCARFIHRTWRILINASLNRNRDEKGSWRLTGCSHVRGPRTLDLLDVFVRLLGEQLVEIGYDLVQESETLDTLVIRLQFHVELGKVWYRGEHYANEVALFVVQLLENVNSRGRMNSSVIPSLIFFVIEKEIFNDLREMKRNNSNDRWLRIV